MVDVQGITRAGNHVVETAAIDDIIAGEHVLGLDFAAFADAHEGSHLVHPGVFEARDEALQVGGDVFHLVTGHDLSAGVTLRSGGIHAAYAGHVDPYLIRIQAGDEDGAGDGNVQTGFLCQFDALAKAHGDELAFFELLLGHGIHVEVFRMIDNRVAKGLDIHAAHVVHERRGLQAAVLVAFVGNHAGPPGHIGVSGAVDDGLGQDGFPAVLGFHDDTLDGITFFHYARAENIHEHLHAFLFHHVQGYVLGFFGIDDGEAHVEFAALVAGGGAPGCQPVDELLGQAADALFAVYVQEGQDREADGEIAAQIASAFQEHDFFAFSGCGISRHDAGRTAADHDDVGFGAYGNIPCGFKNGFHVYGFN